MNQHNRNFSASDAVRSTVPLLVGLMGPSGGGKTYSALRLAKGIQTVTGGDVYGVDTETRRMLHYADMFKFKHVPFGAPFGSLDYLEALRYCVKQGGKVIIVDSMSHEHEGPGGLLDFQKQELDRLTNGGEKKPEAYNMLAWQKPKAARRQLINGLLQLEANFIFCFRSKETAKPVRINNKTEVVQQGFMPIAGDEFVFEQTVNCLLLPGAGGVPTWKSEYIGERQMMKLPEQFKRLFNETRALDEEIGRELALWARGDGAKRQTQATTTQDDFGDGDEDVSEKIAAIDTQLAAAAEKGWAELKALWETLGADVQDVLRAALNQRHKPRATEVSRAAKKQPAEA